MFSELEIVAEVCTVGGIEQATKELASNPPDLFVISTDVAAQDYVLLDDLAHEANAKVLLILRDASDEALERAARLTADAYLPEGAVNASTLRDTVLRTVGGETVLPASLARGLLAQSRQQGGTRAAATLLSEREKQALKLLVDGMSNKQIATRLGISEHGAKRHVGNLLAKLNCSNRTVAAALAIREGLCAA
jgi:DNA-binding NarL/FixJ family response regulator